MNDASTIRNYRDNFDFKDLTVNTLIPKYFPDQDVSTRMSGMIGFTTEQMAIISEDTFFAASTLLKEFFIQKASLPESLYSYASLFQLANTIGSAATCRFLLVFNEAELTKAFDEANRYATSATRDKIYLGKNTTIYIHYGDEGSEKDIPFILDYDIEITRRKTKLSTSEYMYSAKYITSEFKNTISDIINPYIKIRRNEGGYFALEIFGRQCQREETEQPIIDNSAINYPTIDVKFNGILAGFDAFYRESSNDEWIQLEKRVANSMPEKDPFCFYRIIDENVLRLSFSLSDSYFQPEFNSEIKIVTYTTMGNSGNFPMYTGKNIDVIKDTERYSYNEEFILGVIVASASEGGSDTITLEQLRRLTSTQYSTATVISSDNDLECYFETMEDINGNKINFIKRRDDLAGRLHTGFMVCKNEDYVYPTNTLDISMNYKTWNNPDGGYTYTHDPGFLYVYESGNSNRLIPYYKKGFWEDKSFLNFQGQTVIQNIMRDYFIWLNSVNHNANFGFDDENENWATEYHPSKEPNETVEYYMKNVVKVCNDCGYHTYKTLIEEDGKELCPVCHSENLRKGTKLIDMQCTVFDIDEIEENITRDMFVYSNPFLMTITKYPGLVNYYLTIINQTSLLDFTHFNQENSMQFIVNQANFERPLNKEKEYTVTLRLMCSMQWNPELLIPGITKDEYIPRRTHLKDNFIRVMMVIMDGGIEACYMEMIPISYDTQDDIITFQCKFKTNDHVTLGNQMQLEDYSTDELGYKEEFISNVTEYTMHEEERLKLWIQERELIVEGTTEPPNAGFITDEGFEKPDPDKPDTSDPDPEEPIEPDEPDNSGIQGNFTYITNGSTKLIPMEQVEIRFVTLYKDYEEENDENRITNNYPTSGLFFSLPGYEWTNVYSTFSDRVDLIKPLTMVRSSMYFRDDRLYNVTDGDIYLYSSPMIKYSLLQHLNSRGEYSKNENGLTNYEMFTYMINQWYNQYKYFERILSTVICQSTYVDLKFYNTYGRSKNYIIGDEDEIIDRVNISSMFTIYLVKGTDQVKARDEIKTFLKETIEKLNEVGINDLHVSNIMRLMETQFAYIDHIIFGGFNGDVVNGEYTITDKMGYNTEYQSIKCITKDLNDLSKDERFAYVPEMLCINKDQIVLVFYEMD